MTGHDPEHDDKLPAARALFERASANLDPAMANRLRLVRRAAQSPAPRVRAAWVPAGAAMAAFVAVGLAWWLPEPAATTGAVAGSPMGAPPEWIATDEDADLYAWLGEAPVAIDKTKDGAL